MRAIFLIFIIIFPLLAHAQDTIPAKADTTCIQKDVFGLIQGAFHKTPKVPTDFISTVILLPVIGSNPATGFMVGVGGQYAFKLPGEETHFSVLGGSMQFTSKRQQLFLLKNSVYTKDNKFFFFGDWRYMVYSQSTFGLGTDAPEGGILDYQFSLSGLSTTMDSLAEPLRFNFLRIYQSVSYNITRSLYIGLGYYLDSYFNIEDEKLRLNPGDSLITTHYAYSKYYGFNETKYTSSAIGINLISDTRDNMINPYKGHFAMIRWNRSLNFSGSHKSVSSFSMEWRSFHPLSRRNPRHLVAFWALADLSPEGGLPYLSLPATSYDQRGRSGRGYIQGRFRGNQMVYGEAEYRFPISQCGGLWGGVLFVNATSTNSPVQSLDLFESVKPGYGFGFRLMIDKKSRTNLAIDFGFGEKSTGFYLSASETF